ncbi:MAG: helix-turn-helix domain-containing protein [Chloroflexi bacterium]|nr:helix-turn-helix domain-containing protein [Chloroflexota bacterium]
MSRLRVLTWLAQEERTIPYLAKSSGASVEALVAFLAGSRSCDTEMLAALEVALGLPEGELQRNDDDVARLQPIDGDPLRCYTVDEVAARMQVHPDTVRKEIRTGVLQTIRVGDRGVRIPHSALEIRLNRWE